MTARPGAGVGRAALAACLAAVALAGCGVPTHTDVRVEDPPAEAGGGGTGGQPDPPPGPEQARSEEELVEFFLQAAADPDSPVEALREFLHPDLQEQWQPENRIYVARIDDDLVVTPGDTTRFDLTFRRVGALASDGIVEPLTRQQEQLSFLVSAEPTTGDDLRVGGVRYYLVGEPPPFILLDDAALERFFDWRPVYFWDSDEGVLVPDLRWLRRAVPEAQRPQIVLDWLLAGPSPWLDGTLATVPDGVERVGNVVWGRDAPTLEVRLVAPPEGVDLQALDAQLWWSLRPDLAAGVDATVVVNGTARRLTDGYRVSNAVAEQTPASFAVLDGEIRPYLPDQPEPMPALPEDLAGVERAAVSRDGQLAALVTPEPDGRVRLSLATSREVRETGLVAGAIGQPVWLNHPSGTGLVISDGVLRQFTSGEAAVPEVELPDLAGAVTAVAAAPDGRRLALVAGGRLYVVPVARAGEQISVTAPPRPLPTTATDLEGVAFLREEWLALVGTARGQSRLFELSVDGALERELPAGGLGTPEMGSFVGYAGDPTDADDRGAIMYEADDLTWWYAYPHEPVRVTAEQLGVEEADTENGEPLSPFFLD